MKTVNLLLWLFVGLGPLWSQTDEKLDSLVIENVADNYISDKTVYLYDELGRDTAIRVYAYDQTEAQLQAVQTTRIQYLADQVIKDTYDEAAAELVMRETTTFTTDGQELEYFLEVASAAGMLEPSFRSLTTIQTDTLREREHYEWDGQSLALTGMERTIFFDQDSVVRTTFRRDEETFIPQQRTISHYETETGIETFYLIENYYSLSDWWAPYLKIETSLDIPRQSAYRLTEVADFDTGELEPFDSTTLYYNTDWTIREWWSYRPRGPESQYNLVEQVTQYHTPTAKLEYRELSVPDPVDSLLDVVRIETYYYSDLTIASAEEPDRQDVALELVYPNPSRQPRLQVLGAKNEATYELRVSKLSGQLIGQQRVIGSEAIWLDGSKLPSGLYLLRLIGAGQQLSKIWIVP